MQQPLDQKYVHRCGFLVCFLPVTSERLRRTVPSPGGRRTRPTPRGWRVSTLSTRKPAGPCAHPRRALHGRRPREQRVFAGFCWLFPCPFKTSFISLEDQPELTVTAVLFPGLPEAHILLPVRTSPLTPSCAGSFPVVPSQGSSWVLPRLSCIWGTDAWTQAQSQQSPRRRYPGILVILTAMGSQATILERGWVADEGSPLAIWHRRAAVPRAVTRLSCL